LYILRILQTTAYLAGTTFQQEYDMQVKIWSVEVKPGEELSKQVGGTLGANAYLAGVLGAYEALGLQDPQRRGVFDLDAEPTTMFVIDPRYEVAEHCDNLEISVFVMKNGNQSSPLVYKGQAQYTSYELRDVYMFTMNAWTVILYT
jgi:hypothetical protein